MTSWVVADSNIYLATIIPDLQTERADALIAHWIVQDYTIAAPYLFRYEVMSVVRKHVARETLTDDEGRQALSNLLAQPIQYFADDDLLNRAYELAKLHDRPAGYDSVYLALAERLNCEYWTADLRLFNAINRVFKPIRWLGDFPLPPKTSAE